MEMKDAAKQNYEARRIVIRGKKLQNMPGAIADESATYAVNCKARCQKWNAPYVP